MKRCQRSGKQALSSPFEHLFDFQGPASRGPFAALRLPLKYEESDQVINQFRFYTIAEQDPPRIYEGQVDVLQGKVLRTSITHIVPKSESHRYPSRNSM
jgi:hypothetical protein